MLIFPRVKENLELLNGAPDGSIAGFNKTGYMTKDLFVIWINHFIRRACIHSNGRKLLILDGHSTRIKNIGALDSARENNVDILCLSPHTHQP